MGKSGCEGVAVPWVAVHGDTNGNVAVLQEGGSGHGGTEMGGQCPGMVTGGGSAQESWQWPRGQWKDGGS